MHVDNAPFQPGSTFYDGGTIDSNNLGGLQLEGTEWEDTDKDRSGGQAATVLRSNFMRTLRVVRNVSGIALEPKRLVTPQRTAGNLFQRVDGYADITAEASAYPVDEWVSTVPNNDLCYVVVQGPAVIKTDLAGADNNVLTVGLALVALTAVTSQSTTAGRVAPQDLTGATSPLAVQVQNFIGWAMSAKTTANTNSDALVFMRRH